MKDHNRIAMDLIGDLQLIPASKAYDRVKQALSEATEPLQEQIQSLVQANLDLQRKLDQLTWSEPG